MKTRYDVKEIKIMKKIKKLILINRMGKRFNINYDILNIINNHIKLYYFYKKMLSKKNRYILDLKKLKRESNNEYETNIIYDDFGNSYFIDIPIDHWILFFEPYEDYLNLNKLSKQMIHCRSCGNYRIVSSINETNILYSTNNKIICKCSSMIENYTRIPTYRNP